MKPTQSLPKLYQPAGTLDLSQDKRLALWLNLLGLLLLVLASGFFMWVALILRPEDEVSINFDNILLALLMFILTVIFAVVIHEALHGLCFWLFTKDRPLFGVKSLYAYAAAPDWYLPRTPYYMVALAPLVTITFVGVLLIPLVTPTQLPFLLTGIVINFAGSIGDLAIVVWLLKKPGTVYINDFGDGVQIYDYEDGAV